MALISRKLYRFLLMFSAGFGSLSVLLLFPLWSPSLSLCMVYDSISSNIDEVLLINQSANVFVFADFYVHHKDCLTYSGRTDIPGELCSNFSSQMTLHRWLTFLIESQTVILTVLLFWIYFILLRLVFVLRWLSLHWEILIKLSS